MRVAVCLSGLSRGVQHSIESIKKYLVEPFDADLYVHTWGDISIGGGSKRFLDSANAPVDRQFFYDHGSLTIEIDNFADHKWDFLGVFDRVPRAIAPMSEHTRCILTGEAK